MPTQCSTQNGRVMLVLTTLQATNTLLHRLIIKTIFLIVKQKENEQLVMNLNTIIHKVSIQHWH
jgi:hypothetical protein